MTRTFKLVCGTDEIDLIAITSTDAFKLRRGGKGRTMLNNVVRSSSNELTELTTTKGVRTLPVTEQWRLNFAGTSHDNVGAGMQEFIRLIARGQEYHYKQWRFDPLYIQEQTTNETNPRYSTVLSTRSLSIPDLFNQPFEADNDLDDITIQITREPFFRHVPIQTLPTRISLLTPGMEFFDFVQGSVSYVGEAAYQSQFGARFALGNTDNYGKALDPSAEVEITTELVINMSEVSVSVATDEFTLIQGLDSGANPVFKVRFLNVAGELVLRCTCYLDGGAGAQFTAENLTTASKDTGWVKFRAEWKASTGPGNDDGYLKLYIDDVAATIAYENADNDTYTVDELRAGCEDGDATVTGYADIDNWKWGGTIGAAYERTIDFEYPFAFIPNCAETQELDTIYAYDASAVAFSANRINSSYWAWFSVSGAVPAVGDIMYFGGDEPFHSFVVNVDGDTFNPAVTIEYSTGGGAWTALGSTYWLQSDFQDLIGPFMFCWSGSATWAKDVINGSNKYWIRVTLIGAAGNADYHSGYPAFQPTEPYLEIGTESLKGDIPAMLMMRLIKMIPSSTDSYISDVHAGFKSAGLDSFISRFNAGGDNPAYVATAYFTDTSQVADPTSPHGDKATITFATNATGVLRMTFTIDAGVVDISDFEGTYRVFARCKQTGGNAGDTEIQFYLTYGGARFDGKYVPLTGTTEKELVDLGTVSIFPLRSIGSDEAPDSNIGFGINALSNNGATPNLEIDDLILIPTDELAMWASVDSVQNSLNLTDYIQIDAGVIRNPSVIFGDFVVATLKYSPSASWQMRGEHPRIEPRRRGRLYFVLSEHSYSPDTSSVQAMGLLANIYPHYLYRLMIGDDL